MVIYVWLVIAELRNFIKSYMARNWPTTTGKVLNSELVEEWGSDDIVYKADIQYSYIVKNIEYKSEKIYFGLLNLTSKWPAKYLTKKYKYSDKIVVYYNPGSASDSVLITGINVVQLNTLYALFILGVFAIYFAAALYSLILKMI